MKTETTADEIAATLGQLTTRGWSDPAPVLTPDEASGLHAHFRGLDTLDGHVPATSDGKLRRVGKGAESRPFASHRHTDLLAAPYVIELALAGMGVARAFLGGDPDVYSVNAWWSFPGPQEAGIRRMHRDRDADRFLALFVYLTDVGTDDGPQVYREGTQEGATEGADARILAPAGAGFFTDPRGLHMGETPKTTPRLTLWVRYGHGENFAYRQDRIVPVPIRHPALEDAEARRALRLVAVAA